MDRRADPAPGTPAPAGPPAVGLSVAPAAVLASTPLWLPALLSIDANPAPTNPRILLWYRSLRQPAFKPPDAAVPLAWGVIETALAAAAYRLLRCAPSAARSRALSWLAGNVLMIGVWSRLFFRRRSLPVSTVVAAGMVASGAAYCAQARKVDRPAAALGVPFVVWVGFATVLTAAIWRLNRPR